MFKYYLIKIFIMWYIKNVLYDKELKCIYIIDLKSVFKWYLI